MSRLAAELPRCMAGALFDWSAAANIPPGARESQTWIMLRHPVAGWSPSHCGISDSRHPFKTAQPLSTGLSGILPTKRADSPGTVYIPGPMLRCPTIILDIPMAALPQQVIPDPEAENDFDMDRVVMDPEYRRIVIGRLRRDWRVAA